MLCCEIQTCPECPFVKEKSRRRWTGDYSRQRDESSVNLKNVDGCQEPLFAFSSLFTVKNARPRGSGNEQPAAVSRGDHSGSWGR